MRSSKDDFSVMPCSNHFMLEPARWWSKQ